MLCNAQTTTSPAKFKYSNPNIIIVDVTVGEEAESHRRTRNFARLDDLKRIITVGDVRFVRIC